MLRNIFLVLLLIYAVNAAQLEISEVDSAEDQDKEIYDEIKANLHKVCDKFRSDPCKRFVEKYMDKLVKELMTKDAPKAICTKILVC